jgi:cytochrome c oxidase subunit 4
MARRHVSSAAYLATFGSLIALTALTFSVSFLELGAFEVPVALAIAMAKGTLVALFFMHLIEQRFVNRMVLIISVLFIALLVTLVVADVATRHTFPVGPEM